LVALGAQSLAGQDASVRDAYRDDGTRALVERAIAGRSRSASGIESYEATLRQRMYVGVTALRFRRERSLFESERVARIRWSSSGERGIRWIGARTAIPIAGIDTADPDSPAASITVEDDSTAIRLGDEELPEGEVERDTADDLLDETDFPAFDFDPASDRLTFGDDWAFHPLADSSWAHYRFAPGDTLRLELPANQQSVVLYEVLVEPRRADFDLVAGSLWLDSASAALVRATYRPARAWSMRVDDPEAAAEVPGFVGPIEAEVRYITVENSLQELQFWLPRRFAFQGEARAGSLFRIPVTLEWSVGGYVVNEPPLDVLVDGPLPEGWQRAVVPPDDDDAGGPTVTVVVPTTEELRTAVELSQDFGTRTPVTFTQAEVDDLARDLEGLLPTYQRFRPSLAWGLEDANVRFNRVEGLSVGVSGSFPLAPERHLDASVRIGSADQVPNLSLGIRLGTTRDEWTIEGYHRLASMNDVDEPFRLASSAMNLVFGTDRGEYYRATGGSVAHRSVGTTFTTEVRGFHERQGAVDRYTDWSIRHLVDDYVPKDVVQAEAVDITGGSARLGWFVGTDPKGLIVTGSLGGEVGFGEAEYRRLAARLSASHPLPIGLAGALEVEAGTSWGNLTPQRSFFLGSWTTLRGFDLNEHRGASFWRARGELATGFAGARVATFSDLGWVGRPADFRFDDPLLGVGAGLSLLDGIVRFDVARAILGARKWKVYLYLDGLF